MDKEEIAEAFQARRLFQLIFESMDFVHGDQKDQIQARCIELHNEGTIDLLGIVTTDALQDIDRHKFFVGQHFFVETIPRLEASADEMMRAVRLLVDSGGSDLAANQPNGAFKIWCEADPTRAESIVEGAKSGKELALEFLTFALSAKADVTEAIKFVDEYSDKRCLSGIVALGRMTWKDRSHVSEALSAFSRVLQRDADSYLRLNILIATLDIATKTDMHDRASVVGLVTSICESSDSATPSACAQALWAYGKTLDEDLILLLLERVKSLDPEDKGTIGNLDHGLSLLMGSAHSKHAIAFVKDLLTSSGDQLNLTEFDSFSRALIELPTNQFNGIFASWMLSGVPALCQGISSLLASLDRRETPLDLSLEIARLSSQQKLFLCRKAIGYLFIHPVVATSVLVSALRTDLSAEAATEVRRLLFDPLLVNYEGSVREFLQTIPTEDASHSQVAVTLEKNEEYLDGLNSTGEIKEIEPTEHQRQVEMLRNNDQARQIHKDAMKKSILHDLVSRSVVLYGRRTLAYLEGPDGTRTPFEMDLKEHGMSFELPRMDIIDPIGLDYIIRVFRVEELKS